MISTAEKKEQLEFNKIEVDYDKKITIHQLFEAQVENAPNNIAAVFKNEKISYKELNEKANQLAHYLIEEGIQGDDLVAICLDRSLDMFVGLLGILKSGGAYLPIDPTYPKERIEYTLQDSKAKILISQESLMNVIPHVGAKFLGIDTLDLDAYSMANPMTQTGSTNLAYVIYTSGTTGKPKGVMLEHANVDRLFQSTQNDFNFTEEDVWTFFHSFAFDFAVWEIWGALLFGGKLVVVPYEISRSPKEFYELMREEKVTILNQTPSAFKQLLAVDKGVSIKISSLRYIIFGGEKLDFGSLGEWYANHSELSPVLVNMYGITETTVHTTFKALSSKDIKNEKSLIGKTLNDLGCYILDEDRQLVAKGQLGELYIIGAGLARGYLNQPELTNERFMENIFVPNTKMYKTGDLARYTKDGDIEYMGRTDDQVQLRGFRIELGEIEQQLLVIENIKEGVVLAKNDLNNELALFAYITTKNNVQLDLKGIRIKLLKNIPEYMLPTAITILEIMPLTPNGKIDKKALVKLDVKVVSTEDYVAPRNEIEEQLSSIFESILKIEKVGINDNFFELGGHSLLAVQLVSFINEAFATSLAISVLFQAPTIEKLNLYIKSNNQRPDILIPIQTQGNKRAIFGLPGAGGSTVIYKELSKVMGKAQPFYGLDVLYPTSSSSAINGIRDIAKANVKAMKSIQPKGPYRLIGYCMGSLVAYEMARILKGEIESIIMISVAVPKNKNYRKLYEVTKSLAKFETKKLMNKMSRSKLFRFAKNKLIKHSKTQLVEYSSLSFALYKLKPMESSPKMTLLFINDKNIVMDKQNTMNEYGWNYFIDKDVNVDYIEGEHLTVLLRENITSLNNTITKYLEDK